MKRKIILAVLVAGVAAAVGISLTSGAKTSKTGTTSKYEFTEVSRGDLESVVSASGTLAAVSTVSILSEMSGRVEKVYADYNDRVKKGQILVALNTDMLRLEEKEYQAAVRKAQANYDLQRLNFENQKTLLEKNLVSEYAFKTSESTLAVSAAELASAQSALDIIETKINQYALITSPIDGIVLDKDVDVGQSVVEGSSSNASSLFTLAEDLSKMKIEAEVDELDISSIRKGQSVRFTVEARPEVTYTGTVDQIRLVPETSDNVVTYYVIISADNKDGTLLPGMTASVEFINQSLKNVLLVPSAALRFRPAGMMEEEIEDMEFLASLEGLPEDQRTAALDSRKAAESGSEAAKTTTQQKGLTGMVMPMGGPGGPPGTRRSTAKESESSSESAQTANRKYLWYLDDKGSLAVRMVQAGSSDSLHTQILGADDLEGKSVILKVKVE